MIALMVIGGHESGTKLQFTADDLKGIAATDDGGMVISITSRVFGGPDIRRGLVVKTDQDGAVLWRRILTARDDGLILAIGGVANSQDGEVLVVLCQDIRLLSCYPEEEGFHLYKLDEKGDSTWERKLELSDLNLNSTGDPRNPLSVLLHSSGAVILNLGMALVLVDEEANVLWVYDGTFEVVTEAQNGDIVAVGKRHADSEGFFVVRRFDIEGNLIWERDLTGKGAPYSRFANSIAASQAGEFLILTRDEVLLVIDGDGELIEIREDEAFEQATSVIVANNTDIIIGSRIGLIRWDPQGAEVWRNEAIIAPQPIVETPNGDILVAKTFSLDVVVTRVNSDGDILFSRSFDGEGNGGFIDE